MWHASGLEACLNRLSDDVIALPVLTESPDRNRPLLNPHVRHEIDSLQAYTETLRRQRYLAGEVDVKGSPHNGPVKREALVCVSTLPDVVPESRERMA